MERSFSDVNTSLYEAAPFCHLRIPALSYEQLQHILCANDREQAALAFFLNTEPVREAILVASPTLYATLLRQDIPVPKKALQSLLQYLYRMALRATPFGLFASVHSISFAATTTIDFSTIKHTKRVRPDMGWLFESIQSLYADTVKLKRLPVEANALIQKRGNEYVLDYIRTTQKASTRSVVLQRTPLIESIFSLATKPIVVDDLCCQLTAACEESATSKVDIDKTLLLIEQLVEKQFLLPAILPSLLDSDPYTPLRHYLPKGELLYQAMTDYSTICGEEKLALLTQMMEGIRPSQKYVQVDSMLTSTKNSLNKALADEARKGVEVLWKLSTLRKEPSFLNRYHSYFIEKYGTSRTVPLLDVAQEFERLGKSEKASSVQNHSLFDHWLISQWQGSSCGDVIEITDDVIEELGEKEPNTWLKPDKALPSLEVLCKVIASSQEAIDRGDFSLAFVDLNWQQGSSLGRFHDMLDRNIKKSRLDMVRRQEDLEKGLDLVQLAFWPRTARSANVATASVMVEHVVDLQGQKGPIEYKLDDICIGASTDRLYITTKKGERELSVYQATLLNWQYAPFPFQLLHEISLGRSSVIFPFSYGALTSYAAFLPRVVYQKVILFPATWHIRGLIYKGMSKAESKRQFAIWARRWQLPKQCVVVKGDRRLPFEQSDPCFQDLVIQHLQRGDDIFFEEYLASHWLLNGENSYFSEIIIPFIKKESSAGSLPEIFPSPYVDYSLTQRTCLLGSKWIYVKLYYAGQSDDLIIQLLRETLPMLGMSFEIKEWHFVRYADPDRHIRLRVCVFDQAKAVNVAVSLSTVAQSYMENGLVTDVVFAAYHKELERYGGEKTMEVVETWFTHDSNIALHLSECEKKEPLCVFYAQCIVAFLRPFQERKEEIAAFLWKAGIVRSDKTGYRAHRQLLAQKIALLFEDDAWNQMYEYATAAAEPLLTQLDRHQETKREEILDALLHMHCNRLGCTPQEERQARCYAYYALGELQRSTILA